MNRQFWCEDPLENKAGFLPKETSSGALFENKFRFQKQFVARVRS